MRKFLFALGTLVLLTLPGTRQLAATTRPTPAAPTRPAPTADEQLFAGLVEQVGTAIQKNDMKALGQLMTPDYTHYTPDNNVGHRTEELAYVGKWVGTTVKQVTPLKVTRRGDMAVTVASSTFSGTFEGKPFSNTINMMIAWELRDGHWQMAVVHSKVVNA
ncbi:nuclear transport factor 2 family protein [Hymenobacter bucti]|uniref:Nuclear transport factor 2 family protein n=1 Tax=Hymenobacter bucti TaxID=1844114 RepID=A0ABW4QRT6_9BACT